jgi:5'-methylthioinosine phosphorylase
MLAIIGGSGLDQFPELKILEEKKVSTPYGDCSALVTLAEMAQKKIVFLPRHGKDHKVAPHHINYRANIWALKEEGVTQILAINAVGGINKDMGPSVTVVPDQIIDYTYGREQSFNLWVDGYVQHIDFSQPYHKEMRKQLIEVLKKSNVNYKTHGVYGCTQGPRLETAAEIQQLQRDGCDLVGMTAMPEAALARELNMDYAALCLVVNWAAGIAQDELSMQEIMRNLNSGMDSVKQIIKLFITNL